MTFRAERFHWGDDGKFDWHPKVSVEDKFDPDQPREPAGTPEGGRWTAVAGGGGFEFVSPNIEHSGFEGAIRGLGSDRQKALRLAAAEIDGALGLDSVHTNIIGAWADGAENSILGEAENPDWDKLKLGAAMKGYLADQKSVLLFKQDDKGKAVLYKFVVPGTIESVHKEMLQGGLAFHTLQKQDRGVAVYVVDLDGSLHDQIEHASGDSEVEYQFGRAEFIGTTKEDGTDRQQRDDARSAYQAIIGESKVQDGAKVWERVHHRWGEALNPKSGKIIQVGRNQPFEVIINPSENDLRGMARDAPENSIRVILDRDKNLYAWEAYQAIHSVVERELDLSTENQDEWIFRDNALLSRWIAPGKELLPNIPTRPEIKQEMREKTVRARKWVRDILNQVPAITAFNKALA